jgi:shikimate dehydrogenase
MSALLSGRTTLYFHLADPVFQVKAPALFNAAFAERDIDAVLVPLHVPSNVLAAIFPALGTADNVGGLLVTMPHKQSILPLCGRLGRQASRVRAANAVRFGAAGESVGEMFDGLGMLRAAAQKGIDFSERPVLLLGAGGAARAIAFAVADAGASSLIVSNRSNKAAASLVVDLRKPFPNVNVSAGDPVPSAGGVVINSTSLGMKSTDAMPLNSHLIEPSLDIVDIVTVSETPLLRAAQKCGCNTISGEEMLKSMVDPVLTFWTNDDQRELEVNGVGPGS